LLCVDVDDPGSSVHPVRPQLPKRRISIAWRAGRTLSPVAERFVQLNVEQAAAIADRALPAGRVA
jgi:hypothetical protein